MGTVKEACQNLWEVLEEWILLKIKDGDAFPKIEVVEIKVSQVGSS